MHIEPLSLAIDCRMIRHSGIGTYLENIINHLSHRTDLFLICLGDQKLLESFSWSSSVRIISCSAPIFSIREQFELPMKIPACDLFWSPQYNIPIFPIRAKKRIVTIHDVYHMAFYHTLSLHEKLYASFMLRAAVWLSDMLITVSEFSRREILRYLTVENHRIHVIYNGAKMFPEANTATDFFNPSPYILFVGNVKPHKNLKNAMAAFSQIKNEFPDLFFVIVGEHKKLRTADTEISSAIAASESHIRFTGHIDDATLGRYYKNAALLLFPSYYEGFGLPILEAMYFGIPIAASKASSIPEIGTDAVVYFDPSNMEEMAEAIRQILQGRHSEKLGKYPMMLNSFTWEKSAEAHAKLFKRVLSC